MSERIKAVLQLMRALTFLGFMMTVTSGLYLTQFMTSGLWATFTTGALLTFFSLVGYQVILTKEVDEHPNSRYLPRFDVYVLPSVNSLTVSSEFLEPESEYELEVLALEQSGNQIISIVFFETE